MGFLESGTMRQVSKGRPDGYLEVLVLDGLAFGYIAAARGGYVWVVCVDVTVWTWVGATVRGPNRGEANAVDVYD
jgi:hypothetical protein